MLSYYSFDVMRHSCIQYVYFGLLWNKRQQRLTNNTYKNIGDNPS